MQRAASIGGVFLLALAAGCGTNRPDIPDDYKTGGSGGASGYPAGPYAQDIVGDTGLPVADVHFAKGWLNPKADGYDPAKLVPISLSDFYDPDGSKGNELLLLNTAAVWCSACKNEHKGNSSTPSLSDHVAALGPRGLVVVSSLFQDASSDPATEQDLATWASTFETDFPFVLDPEYQLGGRYVDSATAPLNLVVDARTMKLLHGWTGDQSAVIWPFVEAELQKRGK
jgi:hypothetical protein